MVTLESCIRTGQPALIEDFATTVDPAIETLFQQKTQVMGGTRTIVLGDSMIPYSENFKLFLSTSLENPNYPPEIQNKVALLNFMITQSGLSEQLLGILVACEEPELEKENKSKVHEWPNIKKQLLVSEEQILEALTKNARFEQIFENEDTIQVLVQA